MNIEQSLSEQISNLGLNLSNSRILKNECIFFQARIVKKNTQYVPIKNLPCTYYVIVHGVKWCKKNTADVNVQWTHSLKY